MTPEWEAGMIERVGPGLYGVNLPWAKHLRWHMHSVGENGSESGVYVTIAKVTPAMAELMLQNAMANRSVKPSALAKLRRQLERNLWIFNAVPMLFNRRGELGDGQHRARSGMLSGVAFDSLLIVGVSDEAIIRTVDTNVTQSAADRLGKEGHVGGKDLSACCRLVHSYLCDDYTFRAAKSAISDQEILDMVTADARIERAARLTRSERGWTGILQPAVVSFLRYLLGSVDATGSEVFLERLRTGVGIMHAGDPIGQLRQQLQNRRLRRQSIVPSIVIPMTIRAWNIWRECGTCGLIRHDGDFPRPR